MNNQTVMTARSQAHNQFTQYELCKNIYSSGFFKKVKLKNTAKLVLIALANHYNAEKEDMFPSQRYLAEYLDISEKSVERAIAELRNAKIIIYVTQRVNHYKFTNYFYESVKMSENMRQDVGSVIRQNVGQTNKHEQRKNNYKGNFSKNEPPATFVPSVEQTRELLKKYEEDAKNVSSPLDLSASEALVWLDKLPRMVQNSLTSRLLKQKYNIVCVDGKHQITGKTRVLSPC